MLSEARIAIAAKLTEGIDELQVSPLMLSDPTPPAAHVFPTPVEYDETFQRGADDWTFTLQVFVSTGAGDEAMQLLLDEYLEPYGPRSVKECLEVPDAEDGSVTLGGVVGDLRVVRSEGYRLYVREGRPTLFGSEWIIEVSAPGREED